MIQAYVPLLDSSGVRSEIRVTLAQILMSSKELSLYIEVYNFFLDLIKKNGVELEKLNVRTDQEVNLFLGLELAFGEFCIVNHHYCKRHYCESLKTNLNALN